MRVFIWNRSNSNPVPTVVLPSIESVNDRGYRLTMFFAMIRHWALFGFTSIFLMSSTSTRIICRLSAGKGLFPVWMALLRVGGIWSHFTLKLSGQLALAGKGDVGEEDWDLLGNDESCWMHGDIGLGVAEIDSGSGMGRGLHLYVLKSMLITCCCTKRSLSTHLPHNILTRAGLHMWSLMNQFKSNFASFQAYFYLNVQIICLCNIFMQKVCRMHISYLMISYLNIFCFLLQRNFLNIIKFNFNPQFDFSHHLKYTG